MYLVIPPGSPFLRLMASTLLLSVSQLVGIAVQDCELNGTSVNPANGSTTEGKTGIMRCKDRDSGLLVREQELRVGAFVGLVRHFKDGVLSKEFSVNAKGNHVPPLP